MPSLSKSVTPLNIFLTKKEFETILDNEKYRKAAAFMLHNRNGNLTSVTLN